MTGRRALRPVCLIGPPAAGKTTLADALHRALGAPVVRPRDLIDRAVSVFPSTINLFPRDARGFVPDDSLGFALRVCLDTIAGTVIFEGLPWDRMQLADFYRVAGSRIVLLHLQAPDELVGERRRNRRYCPKCYPRSPFYTGNNAFCGCGETLTARPDDRDGAFTDRLRRHRANATGILGMAGDLGIDVLELNAAWSPGRLTARACSTIRVALERSSPQYSSNW